MPKLLQITTTRNQGSVGKITEQIGIMMKQRGWEVYVAHGARYVNPSQLPSFQIQSKSKEYLHALNSYLFDADGLGSIMATKRLVEYVRELQPDLIQIHNLHGYYVNYKLLFDYLNTTNIPIVMTLHDCWTFTGHCIHFVTANCNKWKFGCQHCSQIHSAPKSILFDKSSRNYQLKQQFIAGNKNIHIVTVSKWLDTFVRESFFKNHDIRHISNGIDLDLFRPSKEKRSDKFCILGVGNPWSKDKGLYDIYQLRKMLPVEEYEITLVGLSQKQKDALPEGICGILRTNNQQALVDLYSESHVFINPTYADTFPTTNLEALACGTPVITYRTGGSPEAISQDTGVIVEQGNIEELAANIRKMKEQPFSSSDCRLRAEKLYDKDVRFMDYIKLYEDIIGV